MPASTVYFAFPGKLETPSGGYHYDRRLIAELRANGFIVECLELAAAYPFPNQQDREHAAETLANLPDGALVIIDGLAFGVMAAIAAAEAERLRLIALCHHPLSLESGLDRPRRQALHQSEKKALGFARAVIVTSAHTSTTLMDDFSVPASQITVALPGTDPVPQAACDGNPMRLLTVASLIQRKAHDVLVTALASLRDLPWRARFVGSTEFDPAWAERISKQVRNSGLQDRIIFSGPVSDPKPEYLDADAFVLPSRYEGYGMVFAEALAAGLPIVAARAGAVPDVVPESAGLLVPPDDADALASALRRLLTNTRLRQDLRRQAQEAATRLPTWSESAQRVAATLKEVQRS